MLKSKDNSIGGTAQQSIAQRLGVSQMTVSRVVNNRAGVGKKLREKILAEIRKSGYVLDNIAAGLRGSGTKIIGLVIPDVSNSFFPEITTAIETAARENGYWVTLAHSHEDYALECQAINMLRGFRVEGFIIAPCGGQNDIDIYQTLEKAGTPYVFIDRLKTDFDANAVVTDVYHGAYELGKYLCAKGYRRWGYLRGLKGVYHTKQHSAGLRKSISESGKDIEIIEVTAGFEEDQGYEAAEKLFEKAQHQPDVIVAVNDPVAYGALAYLKQKGLRVPKDIALAGFSDLKLSGKLEVPLTTVAEATVQMGVEAFALLKNMIENPDGKPQCHKLQPKLIIRGSA